MKEVIDYLLFMLKIAAAGVELIYNERPISVQEVLLEQLKNSCCRLAPSPGGLPGSACDYNKNGFVMLIAPIDGAVEELLLYYN